MKIPLWVCLDLDVATAFMIGRHFERAATLQIDVNDAKARVGQLEVRNTHHEERWGWAGQISSRIPLVKNFFKCD